MSNIEVEDNSRYETYAYFYVANFEGDASAITRKLELEPTRTWHKGDSYLPFKTSDFVKTETYSNWEIHSPLERSEIFLDAHIEAVLDLIEPKREQILQFQAQGYDIGINCVGYYHCANPGFHMSAKLLSRLASFSFDVDLDLYCSCEDDNEEQTQESLESEGA